MEITARMVQELREMTGAGMMDCKKALTEAGGDMDKAVDILRTKGLAALQKKAGRATNEGVVAAYVSDDKQVGVLTGEKFSGGRGVDVLGIENRRAMSEGNFPQRAGRNRLSPANKRGRYQAHH